MSGDENPAHREDTDEWHPMTSKPGELYTWEGQHRQLGHFLRASQQRGPLLRLAVRVFAVVFIVGFVIALVGSVIRVAFG